MFATSPAGLQEGGEARGVAVVVGGVSADVLAWFGWWDVGFHDFDGNGQMEEMGVECACIQRWDGV